MRKRNGSDETWERALKALNEGNWGLARDPIAELVTLHKTNAVDALPTISEAIRGAKRPCPGKLTTLLGGMLDDWNNAVMKNWGLN